MKYKLAVLTLVASLGFVFSQPVLAGTTCANAADCVTQGSTKVGGTAKYTDAGALLKLISNVLLFLIGAVSVIMIIFGGIKYTVSQGDSSAITSAKNTILYAVVGLVVAILAYAIVQFVVGTFMNAPAATQANTRVDPRTNQQAQ